MGSTIALPLGTVVRCLWIELHAECLEHSAQCMSASMLIDKKVLLGQIPPSFTALILGFIISWSAPAIFILRLHVGLPPLSLEQKVTSCRSSRWSAWEQSPALSGFLSAHVWFDLHLLFKVRKLRTRRIKQLSQVHPAPKQWSLGYHPPEETRSKKDLGGKIGCLEEGGADLLVAPGGGVRTRGPWWDESFLLRRWGVCCLWRILK